MRVLPLTPKNLNREVIIGFFDVLHHGHAKLFASFPKATILTFNHIPRKTGMLNDLETRVNNLRAMGFKKIIVMDLQTLNMPAQQFVDQYLKHTKRIIVGSDFVFGNDQQSILHFEQQLNLTLISYDKRYSTSMIKQYLLAGKIEAVNELLLTPFTIAKVVQHGNHLGRVLGFPTINFYCPKGGFLQTGVYLTTTTIKKKQWPSLSVAINQKQIHNKVVDTLETHIIGFNGDLYDQVIKVTFHKKLGDLTKTKNTEELKTVIQGFVDQVKLNKAK